MSKKKKEKNQSLLNSVMAHDDLRFYIDGCWCDPGPALRLEGIGKELTEEASQNSGAFKVKSNKSLIVSDGGAADKLESHCSSETKSPAPVLSRCSSDWCEFELMLFWAWIFNRVPIHGWSLTRELLQVSLLRLTQATKPPPPKNDISELFCALFHLALKIEFTPALNVVKSPEKYALKINKTPN